MLYLLIKTIHIVAAIFWIGSLILITLITSSKAMDAAQMGIATRITEASIGATWLAGVVLVVMGGWHLSTWWQIKIVLVILVSAIHTIVHRRWKASTTAGAQTQRLVPILLSFLTIIIVGLVVFKQPV